MKTEMKYGYEICRPRLMVSTKPPTDQELRSVKWNRFKYEAIQVFLIAAMVLCFSVSLAGMFKLVGGL